MFVHGDFHPRHVLTAGSRVRAVIDWADCGVAAPWLDLARAEVREPDRQEAMLAAYFPSGAPGDAAAHLANHHLLYGQLALVREHEGGGDRLHERVPGIEAGLATCR